MHLGEDLGRRAHTARVGSKHSAAGDVHAAEHALPSACHCRRAHLPGRAAARWPDQSESNFTHMLCVPQYVLCGVLSGMHWVLPYCR